jgi:hypothetical protein
MAVTVALLVAAHALQISGAGRPTDGGAVRYSSGLQCEPQQRGEMETARLPSESPQLRSHSPYIAVENRGLTGPYRPRSYAANIPVYRSGAQANGRHLGALVCGPRLVRVRRRW